MFSTFALRNEKGGCFLRGWLLVEMGKGPLAAVDRIETTRKKERKNKAFLFCFNQNFFYLCSPARNGVPKARRLRATKQD
jgi:hypothetical protein